MSTSRMNFFRWASLVSLVAPLIAYALCSEVSTRHLYFHAPPWGQNVGLLCHYAFLVSAIIGAFVLVGDIVFKRWWLFWLPLAGLILTYLLFVEAASWFTRFLD